MIDDFDFTIYEDVSPLIKDGNEWYLTPLYDYEYDYIKSTFKENVDYIVTDKWSMNEGFDVLINQKIYMWLVLHHGSPHLDKTDKSHNVYDIIHKLQSI